MKVNTSYLDPSRPDIRSLVGTSSNAILDVRCNAGALGHALKQEHDCIVWGIEENPSLLKRAEKKLDKVLGKKLEEAVHELPEEYFDAVIFPNAFESLVNPYDFLLALKKCLKPGGRLFLSLFNIRQWTVIKSLIEGHWNYDYYGPLMGKNLRLYTQEMVSELLRNTGFYVGNLSIESIPDQKVPGNVLEALQQTGLNVSTLDEDSDCMGYIFQATLPDTRKEGLRKADAFFEKKDYQRALQGYQEAFAKNSMLLEAVMGAARCCHELKNNKDAIEYLKHLLGLDPSHGEAYCLFGSIAASVGDIATAEDLLLTSIMKEPSFRKAKEQYGKVLGAASPDFSRLIAHQLGMESFKLPLDSQVETKGRFFVNSIPKAGSNLLSKALGLFPGIQASKVVVSRPDSLPALPTGNMGDLNVGRDTPWGDGSSWEGGNNVPIGVDWPLPENAEKLFYALTPLRANQFAEGHVPYSEAFAQLLRGMGIRSFVIVRDPRDIVVSHARFVSSYCYNTLFDYYLSLTEEERIMASIQGISDDERVELLNISQRLESILAWSQEPDVCMISFEGIIGPQGGGTLEGQRAELKKIAAHLSIEMSATGLDSIGKQLFGGTQTFRKGMIGSWREAMTEEHKAACKQLIGQRLIDLGYEKGGDW